MNSEHDSYARDDTRDVMNTYYQLFYDRHTSFFHQTNGIENASSKFMTEISLYSRNPPIDMPNLAKEVAKSTEISKNYYNRVPPVEGGEQTAIDLE